MRLFQRSLLNLIILIITLIFFQNTTLTPSLNPIAECKANSLCTQIYAAMMIGRTDNQGHVNNELELIDLAADRLGYGLNSIEPYMQPKKRGH